MVVTRRTLHCIFAVVGAASTLELACAERLSLELVIGILCAFPLNHTVAFKVSGSCSSVLGGRGLDTRPKAYRRASHIPLQTLAG